MELIEQTNEKEGRKMKRKKEEERCEKRRDADRSLKPPKYLFIIYLLLKIYLIGG